MGSAGQPHGSCNLLGTPLGPLAFEGSIHNTFVLFISTSDTKLDLITKLMVGTVVGFFILLQKELGYTYV